jgi:hypothetical protein
MKKIYMIISAAVLTLGMNAQSPVMTRQGTAAPTPAAAHTTPATTLAAGDTLVYIPFLGIQVNANDQAAFNYQTEDLDGFSTSSTNNYGPDFNYFYSLSPWDYHPWENQSTDSSFFTGATSWFNNDPAQADNWMEFGPITVPAGGATLSWFVKTNPTYRDGYEVLLSNTGMTNYSDFTSAPIYSRADLYPSTSTNNVDTIWQPVSVAVPAGTQYVAFHHNATGMDVLYLDEILMIEGPASVQETNAAFSLSQNIPNPAANSTVFNYNLTNNSDVTFNVYDVEGKVVFSSSEANQSAGAHRLEMNTSNLSNGMYFYTITVNGQTETRKMTVSNN